MKSIKLFLVLAVLAMASGASAWDDLTPMEKLGKALFFGKISSPKNQACADCHAPSVGFTGALPGPNVQHGIYRGANPRRFGNRKPPSNAYITFSPIFHYDGTEFFGGNFWDGRATGEVLGSAAADQALGPFLAPVEQNMPSPAAVVELVADARYAWMFEAVFGEPISYETAMDVEVNYHRIGLAIAAYEASPEVNQFSSKFDLYWEECLSAGNDPAECGLAEGPKDVLDPNGILTDQEFDGLIEFGEYCAPCHTSHEPGPGGVPPLFTNYGFENIGIPRNPDNPFYDMDEVYLDNGDPINPLGEEFIDLGLGEFLRTRPEWADLAEENDGKFKVPTVRNVDKGPGNGFPKAFMHNGFFTSLEDVVHFYNTRDVPGESWPAPEVAANLNQDILEGVPLGDLQLDMEAEHALVAFLKTLSDGYEVKGGEKKSDGNGDAAAVPVSMKLAGPNPFNPLTRIEFGLPAAGPTRIDAYDLSGRKVATLVDGWREAGRHHVTFNADDLPSGVYFLHLVSGDMKATTKVALLK